jgi:signal peptidase II
MLNTKNGADSLGKRRMLVDKVLPFSLTIAVLLADKLSKYHIAHNYPIENGRGYVFIKDVFNNGLLEIIHVRNNAIAFSLGSTLPDFLRPILFIALPIVVLILVAVFYYFKSDECSRLQRWAVAGIIGGGFGNITDRMFPPAGQPGVVDFISVKFFGIFGYERWPTFNIADSSVVICVIIWIIALGFVKNEKR